MVLNTNNYVKIINSYSREDWRPLMELIPKIEKTKHFGDSVKWEEDEEGPVIVLDSDEASVIRLFREIVYQIPIIIDFNWPSWDEGRKIVRDENFDFDTIDIPAKCKLITAFMRNDRFCHGALLSAFKSGVILKILKSIERQLEGEKEE